MKELTFKSFTLGVALAMVSGFANVYLSVKDDHGVVVFVILGYVLIKYPLKQLSGHKKIQYSLQK